MPNSKNQQRRGSQEDKNRRGNKLPQKSKSFHGRISESMAAEQQLLRPKTAPSLISFRTFPGAFTEEIRPKLTKLLLNVTIRGSLGPVQVIMSPESTVGDLAAAALRQYAKEGRRPILPSTDPTAFGLHYSQFSLESLEKEEKLMVLGSRNFFLCPKSLAIDGGETTPSPASTCSKEAEKASKSGFQWLKFMSFLL